MHSSLAQRIRTAGHRVVFHKVLAERDLPTAKTVDDVAALLPWNMRAWQARWHIFNHSQCYFRWCWRRLALDGRGRCAYACWQRAMRLREVSVVFWRQGVQWSIIFFVVVEHIFVASVD